jgi:hypothetical protein
LPGLTRQSIPFAKSLYEENGPAGHKGVAPVFEGYARG